MLDGMYVTKSISTGLYPNLDLWTANKLRLQVKNNDIPSRLEISVSFLKGKILGFIYWKKVKFVPAHAIQTYRACGGISPAIRSVGTSCR